jgi:hypothetical protein
MILVKLNNGVDTQGGLRLIHGDTGNQERDAELELYSPLQAGMYAFFVQMHCQGSCTGFAVVRYGPKQSKSLSFLSTNVPSDFLKMSLISANR